MSSLPIYSGGMKRCCIEEIRKSAVRSDEGTTLTCRTCQSPLRVRRGSWEFASDRIPAHDIHNYRLAD